MQTAALLLALSLATACATDDEPEPPATHETCGELRANTTRAPYEEVLIPAIVETPSLYCHEGANTWTHAAYFRLDDGRLGSYGRAFGSEGTDAESDCVWYDAIDTRVETVGCAQ